MRANQLEMKIKYSPKRYLRANALFGIFRSMLCPNCRKSCGSVKPLWLSGINRILARLRNNVQSQSIEVTKQNMSSKEVQDREKNRKERTFNGWCEICLEYFTEEKVLSALHCGHAFHMDCLTNLRKEYVS